MVTSIARQSVIIKCSMQKSVLTGNYEFYYASGLLTKQWGVEIAEDIRPQELQELLQGKVAELKPKDEREEYLLQMLGNYRAGEEYDEQMKELLSWGRQENRLWML